MTGVGIKIHSTLNGEYRTLTVDPNSKTVTFVPGPPILPAVPSLVCVHEGNIVNCMSPQYPTDKFRYVDCKEQGMELSCQLPENSQLSLSNEGTNSFQEDKIDISPNSDNTWIYVLLAFIFIIFLIYLFSIINN